MKLAVVIVHYNASADLERCLESLAEYAPACSHEIVIVDNASVDQGLERVRDCFPDASWLLNSENVGYSRAVNQGMQAVEADYYLILNPDIEAHPGAVDGLLDFADQNRRAGLVAPQLLNPDGSIQESCRRFYTFATLLLRRTFLGRIWPDSSIVDRHLMRDFDHRSSRPVDWALGGCLLARNEAVARTGALDERFFLYFEDVDWCYRMWRAGWEVVYSPKTRFIHRHRRQSAEKKFSRTFWWHLGSLISFYEKWGVLVYLLKKWSGPLAVLLLWILDMVGLGFSFAGAYGLRRLAGSLFAEPLYPFREYLPVLAFAALLSTVTFVFSGRYRAGALWKRDPLRRLQQVGTVGLLLLASSYLGHQQVVSRTVMLAFLALFGVAIGIGEEWVRWVRSRMERGYLALERTLLVGDPPTLAAWLQGAGDPRAIGVDPVGYLRGEDVSEPTPLAEGTIPCLGTWKDLADVVERYRISQVVFWQVPPTDPLMLRDLECLRRLRIRLRWCIDEAWLLAGGARPELFGNGPSAVLEPGTVSLLRHFLDRVAGAVVGLLLGVLAWPFWLVLRSGGGRKLAQKTGTSLWVACNEKGRSLPLCWQWRLAWPLLTGQLAVVGDPLDEADCSSRTETFWRRNTFCPALTGSWAVADRPEERTFSFGSELVMIGSALKVLFLNPGGLGRVSPGYEGTE